MEIDDHSRLAERQEWLVSFDGTFGLVQDLDFLLVSHLTAAFFNGHHT